jgi:hypothetical protein
MVTCGLLALTIFSPKLVILNMRNSYHLKGTISVRTEFIAVGN